MSNVFIDDQTSRLKQFSWEELDEHFFVAVIFRSGRRYVAQRHFEQQLFFVQSPVIQEKWRRTFFELMSKTFVFLSLTTNESTLMNEINHWHLNMSAADARLDTLIDFEDLFDCSTNFPSSGHVAFLFQPMTTLAAASRTLELWNEQNEASPSPSSSTGWIQIDGKMCPFLQENSSRFLSIDLLLKEHLLSSSDDFALRPSYVRLDAKQLEIFNGLLREIGSGSFRFLLTVHSSFIRLDEFLFRLKRLFFLRFLSSSKTNLLDYHPVMSMTGGLLTSPNGQGRIPFLYIHKEKYFPHFQPNLFSSNALLATPFQLEFLRLISTYEYLCTGENGSIFSQLASTNVVTLLPMTHLSSSTTSISLNDFHYQEYQRRSQRKGKEKFVAASSDEPTGWWHTPVSSRTKRSSINQLKIRPPIYF